MAAHLKRGFPWFILAALALAAVVLSLPQSRRAEARVGPGVHPIIQAKFNYLGNASCAGSGCHSDDKPKVQSGKNIGDEANIWAASDPHHAAFKTLVTDA